jgi:hypothetical protein
MRGCFRLVVLEDNIASRHRNEKSTLQGGAKGQGKGSVCAGAAAKSSGQLILRARRV